MTDACPRRGQPSRDSASAVLANRRSIRNPQQTRHLGPPVPKECSRCVPGSVDHLALLARRDRVLVRACRRGPIGDSFERGDTIHNNSAVVYDRLVRSRRRGTSRPALSTADCKRKQRESNALMFFSRDEVTASTRAEAADFETGELRSDGKCALLCR